ncbi:MAG: sensor histidine kinase [Campylobacterales bacterium]|nr:sensor histidine kinase [Campylobacterales bacterium]
MKRRVWKEASLLFGVMVVVASVGLGGAWLWGFWVGFVLALGVAALVSPFVASYLLSSLFQTNHLLERLVRETLHELNAPLATIKTNVHLLEKTTQEEKSLTRLGRITQACTNLYALYEQMEYYIKREIRLVKEETFDAKTAVEACLIRCSGMQREIALSATLTPTTIHTDRIGFEQSVSNLLSNAYKYNHHQGWVKVRLVDGKLCVEDGGVGMDEGTRFRVFDRYYQANPHTTGYGLGLSMVKAYCDAYGIFITLVSKENKGTQVCLHLEKVLVKNEKDAL